MVPIRKKKNRKTLYKSVDKIFAMNFTNIHHK